MSRRPLPPAALPHPIPLSPARSFCSARAKPGLELYELVMANERTWKPEAEVRAGLLRLWQVMQACVERGFRQTGLLPGVLKVRRRAPKLYRILTESQAHRRSRSTSWTG